jgi:hypothetical protein
VLAEQLQLDTLKAALLEGVSAKDIQVAFNTQLKAKELDVDLCQLRPDTLVEIMMRVAGVVSCPNCSGNRLTGYCNQCRVNVTLA